MAAPDPVGAHRRQRWKRGALFIMARATSGLEDSQRGSRSPDSKMKPSVSRRRPLREIITEKLSTVASEILAAVERTLTEYEAEATVLRLELEQIRRPEQFQPRVKEEPTDDELLISRCEVRGGQRFQQQVQQTQETKNQSQEGLSFTRGLNKDQEVDKEGPEITSRLVPVPDLTDQINVEFSHIGSLENYVDLNICILKDWTIEVVTDQVEEEYPVHELPCRSGQQEADFLDLLRSTFPQLAPNTPFESFITDNSRRLQPLKVESFTPEQICVAAGNSALYLRLKCPSEHGAGSEQQLNELSDDNFNEDDNCDERPPFIQLQTAPDAKNEPPDENKTRNEEIPLRIRVLGDPRITCLSKPVLKRYRLKTLKCPCDMEEADFMKLLRSTFPVLAGDRPFEFLMSNLSKKLFPLNLESYTPDHIYKALGLSGLYIRLKSQEEKVQARQKSLKQNKAAPHNDKDSSSTTSQITPKNNLRYEFHHPLRETDTRIDLRIHLLEDSGIDEVTAEVLRTYRLHKLQCPPGMNEFDFLKLLKSTFPQLTMGAFFETFTCDPNMKLQPLNVKSFTPEMISTAAGNSALYIRLKHSPNARPEKDETKEKSQEHVHRPSLQRTTPTPENKSPSLNRVDDKDTHINLRICFLEGSHVPSPHDEHTDPVSTTGSLQLLFNKYPIRELKFPRGLQESGFLNLLKSTFSQLADGQPITVLALQGRKMVPLKVNSVIPEEIWRAGRSVGSHLVCIQQTKPLKKSDAKPEALPTSKHQTPNTSSQSPSGTTGRPPNCDPIKLVDFKVCIVDDPSIDVISSSVLQKYPILEFQCPGSLPEAGFLNLLRSTFPVLAEASFDFLTGHGANTKPFNLVNMTSEEISRTVKAAGSSVLYVRLKWPRKIPGSVKRRHSDRSKPSPGKLLKKRRTAKSQSSNSASHQKHEESEDDETEDSEDENEQKNTSVKLLGLKSLISKYTANSKQVKLKEEPSDAKAIVDDESTDDSEDENYYKNPQVSKLSFLPSQIPSHSSEKKTKTEPVEVQVQRKHSSAKENIKIEDEETEDSEDYDDEKVESSLQSSLLAKRLSNNAKQKTGKEYVKVKAKAATKNVKIEGSEIIHIDDGDDKSAESTIHLSQKPQISGQDAKQKIGTEAVNMEQKEVTHIPNKGTDGNKQEVGIIDIEEDSRDTESPSTLSLHLQMSGQGSLENDTANTLNVFENKDQNHPDPKANTLSKSKNKMSSYSCKLCRTEHGSWRILIKHAWNHVNDPDSVCPMCEKKFDSTDALRTHLQSYRNTHNCKICGKVFISRLGFKRHMDRHEGKKVEDPNISALLTRR
ncbi:uncharacterized protein LOC105919954 isoform X3 [Fundulus heteroclitus]|uniref:uncharacterized protein LOC105919954 isoform X3 n=1 Tax=Fundulus heteroclitus TaxID=8078 RepID=UPI00165BBD4C|nr:uncharacterized protein LOC105919954 isoform X3 [Fundulus heteroclitus]